MWTILFSDVRSDNMSEYFIGNLSKFIIRSTFRTQSNIEDRACLE